MTSRDKKLHEVEEVTNLMVNKDYSKISGNRHEKHNVVLGRMKQPNRLSKE
jgi:hypothetical protein